MIHPPNKMSETGRLGLFGQRFNQLLAFVRATRIVKSQSLDITQSINGTSIEIKSNRDITVQKQTGGNDTVWS